MPATAKNTRKTAKNASGPLYVAAIGASAGGLEAIHQVFDHLPKEGNIAFILIQHLSPNYKSLLVELVSKHTEMQVVEAEQNMRIEQNCVYVIPNNKLITVKSGLLRLEEKTSSNMPNTAIDTFMVALAEDFGEHSIAVILSGTGTDGTKGALAIKEHNGLVIVQDPGSAKFDGMPQSAIAAGVADIISVPEKIPAELARYLRDTPSHIMAKGEIDNEKMSELLDLIHKNSGFDFSQYKMATLIRRVAKHMAKEKVKTADEYLHLLRAAPEKLTFIGRDFLINFTQFFRDRGAFDALEKNVFPELLKNKGENDAIKIWLCAVSTGEEAYSVAILLDRLLQKKRKKLSVKIFATDLNENNIELSAKNSFPLSIAKDIPGDILESYFVKGATTYSVIPRVRRMLVFARQNVVADPPFIKNDLVICRNMLIYMNAALQKKVLSVLHFSLADNGFLFLGTSESAGYIKEGVEEFNAKWKIYRKTGNLPFVREPVKTPVLENKEKKTAAKKIMVKKAPETATYSLNDDFHSALTQDLGFTGYYIDRNGDIRQTVGDYNRFLKLPTKQLNLNLVKMVPQELAIPLNSAIRRCAKEKKTVVLKPVVLAGKKKEIVLDVIVKPAGGTDNYLFVLIGENRVESALPAERNLPVKTGHSNDEYISELESELSDVRTRIQTVSEQMETSNEELQSSNEELLSSNEELQSSNEELQSLNEELHTLNTEHQLKIKELSELNDDLNNYFRSTDIGQVFLDARLQIRKFNPAAVKLINLIETDIGRPIEHISNNIKGENLEEDIRKVLEDQEIVEKEVQLKNGKSSLMRILPYVRSDKNTDGVVMTFVDITPLTELNSLLTGVLNSSVNAIMAFRSVRNEHNRIVDFECTMANSVAARIFVTGREPVGASLEKDVPAFRQAGLNRHFYPVVNNNEKFRSDFEMGDGRDRRYYELLCLKMGDGLVITCLDNTEKRMSENRMRRNYNDLIIARENLKNLNEQLETEVSDRMRELSSSQERFQLIATATNDALWDWDILYDHLWWNAAFYKQMGYEETDHVQSRKFWMDKVMEEDREQVSNTINQATSGNDSTWQIEYRFKKADGTYAYILDRGYILRDEYGTPYRMLGSMFDTSELRKAMKMAKSSQNKFRRIFDSQLIGMVLFNYDGTLTDANQTFITMLGYTRQDVARKKLQWNELTPPSFQQQTANMNKTLKARGENNAYEMQMIRKDGRRIDVMIGAAALHDDEDANAVAYIIDISDQKKADRKQLELENRFSFLADFMPAKIWTTDKTGLADYFNQRWIDYTGISMDQLTGHDWAKIIHPDDREKALASWKHSIATETENEAEYRVRDRKGIYRWHLSRALPYKNTDEEITMWIGTSTDIHEQKTFTEALRVSGNNFRQLADQTPFMIWRVDENGLCTYVNKPWIDFTGISFEESLDIGWSQAVHPEEKEDVYKEFMQVFAKQEIYKSKIRIRRKDGQFRWVLAQSNPVFDVNFQGYIGSFTDITEQHLAQEATKMLMQKKDEFMSIASHELKTPITTMKASLQLAQRLISNKANGEQISTFVERANNQVSKLAILVNDLLDVTKIQAGKMQLTLSRFLMREVIEDSIAQVQHDSTHHVITVSGDPDIAVEGDRHRLEQVMTNFLSNAIKYSPDANDVQIHISHTKKKVRVAVQDFGIGIPGDRSNYVFDRFFRVQESSQKFSGLGLGLYISAEIIQRHHGEVGVDSQEGEGSTFWFEMPLIAQKEKAPIKMAQKLS
ncbi:MAG: PAS domain S-box protein [Mucilaginibacter polytrichastri]|nr:PAS domain S-box protein [Mucilaginibacter polytrichastri]